MVCVITMLASHRSWGQNPADSSEAALAVYADAANFQNNGAFDLAIAEWKKFLDKFPKDPLAPKASHYLGISYMRKDTPQHVAAADAFAQALKDRKFELVEEALSNRGWCLFVAGQEDERNRKQSHNPEFSNIHEHMSPSGPT